MEDLQANRNLMRRRIGSAWVKPKQMLKEKQSDSNKDHHERNHLNKAA